MTRGAANNFMRCTCSECVREGLKGNAEGELSCSSCHKTFNPIDRETPRTTCGDCHNGRLDLVTNQRGHRERQTKLHLLPRATREG